MGGPALASLILTLALPAAAAPEKLTQHAFRKLVERTQGTVLKVVSRPRGTAVLVGVQGELLADLRQVVKGRLAVEVGGERREAVLVDSAPDLGLALLRLPADDYQAAPVGPLSSLKPGSALLGLGFDARGKLRADAGRFAGERKQRGRRVLRTDLPGGGGTAVFNSRGQLVAVHAGRPLGTIAIDDVRARFASPRAP